MLVSLHTPPLRHGHAYLRVMLRVRLDEITGHDRPYHIVISSVPGAAWLTVTERHCRRRDARFRRRQPANDKHFVAAAQNFLHPTVDWLKRLRNPHLPQRQIVTMETMVINRR